MLKRVPRWKRHELMLRWCRMPTGMALVRKIATKAWATTSRIEARLGGRPGASKPAANGTGPETWESWVVGQLIDANVKRVLIVGEDERTDSLLPRLRRADSSITLGYGRDVAGFECIVVRNAATFIEVGIEAASSARVLVVCDAESFDGHHLVSDLLSHSRWQMTENDGGGSECCLVFRRMDAPDSGAGWEILDVLHHDVRVQQPAGVAE
jgi:hypothetical protein